MKCTHGCSLGGKLRDMASVALCTWSNHQCQCRETRAMRDNRYESFMFAFKGAGCEERQAVESGLQQQLSELCKVRDTATSLFFEGKIVVSFRLLKHLEQRSR